MKTDYVSYAITYSCHMQRPDGTCRSDKTMLWVLSRTPTLSDDVRSQLDDDIRDLCVDPDIVIDSEDPCQPETTDMLVVEEEEEEEDVDDVPKCTQHARTVTRRMNRAKSMGTQIADLTLPRCDENGNYRRKQCNPFL
ncbi:uncharacterized protein LOC102803991 [Saccoglossus kowalevskii]|uniref:Uncharacterized protein LOC102803991 n=1 Tax=Saccoglossus kowalevskii TaxID=10224 RepID=A0ABM0LYN2_SACKO|nr:PREDICTED: uncharacterized protein LOC102803991 [Saccoglossus kowalevskii]